MSADLTEQAGHNGSGNTTVLYGAPSPLVTDYIHSYLLFMLMTIGVPLNIVVSYRLWKEYYTGTKTAAEIAQLPFLILKIHTNISDLLILLMFAPTYFGWLLTYAWLAGDILCRIMHALFVFIFSLSSNLVACIAIDRLFGVNCMKNPTAAKGGRLTGVKVMLPISYAIAVIVALPQAFVYRTLEVDPDFPQCVTVWSVMRYEKSMRLGRHVSTLYTTERVYQLGHLLVVFWIPSLVTWICYGIVIHKLLTYSGARPQFTSAKTASEPAKNTNENGLAGSCQSVALLELNRPANTNGPIHVISSRLPLLDRFRKYRSTIRNKTSTAGGDDKWQRNFRNKVLMSTAPVIIGHLVCWAPYNVMAILPLCLPNVKLFKSGYIDLLECLIAFNAVIDPFLYGAFSKTKK